MDVRRSAGRVPIRLVTRGGGTPPGRSFLFATASLCHKVAGMHVLATLLTLLCLGACGPIAQTPNSGVAHSGWGQNQLVARDVEAIMQGIQRAREERNQEARAAPDPSVARPGS
jgi:hypothetical protein